MKLLKLNLNILGNNVDSQLGDFGNLLFQELPDDKRRTLVPKEAHEERGLMFKKGDKMRIPGVLDSTGAKYPFKKVKKGLEGLDTIEFVDPNNNRTYYMDRNEPFNEEGVRISYTNPELTENPGNTSIQLSGLTVIGDRKRKLLKDKISKIYGRKLPDDYLSLYNDRVIELLSNADDYTIRRFFEPYRFHVTPLTGEIHDQDAINFINNDIVERIKILNPDITEEDLNLIRNIYNDTNPEYGSVNDAMFTNPGFNGYHYNGKIYISPYKKFTPTNLSSTLIHENTHGYRLYKFGKQKNRKQVIARSSVTGEEKGTGYTNKEYKLLNKAYTGMLGYIYNKNYPIEESSYESIIEKGTSNTELRYRLKNELKRELKRDPTEKEFRKFVEDYDENKFLNLFSTINGYTSYMYNNMRGLSDRERKRQVKYMKNALLLIAMNDDNNNNTLIAKSGIKIKKKNRGKFTEYCGGNVTQDCINRAKSSGNKTLIKRAVFAENARKWKK